MPFFCFEISFLLLLEKIQDMEALATAPALPKSRKKMLTYKDYAALTPPDSGNYELHNGQIVYMASPTPSHQRIARRLTTQIDNFLAQNKLGEVFFAPLDTVFDEINTLQPDVLFIAKERSSIIGKKKIEGAPDFVVEIQSEGNTAKEMGYKKYIYETFMVREYWVINLKKETITKYLNEEGEFRQVGIFQKGEEVASDVLGGFQVSLIGLSES